MHGLGNVKQAALTVTSDLRGFMCVYAITVLCLCVVCVCFFQWSLKSSAFLHSCHGNLIRMQWTELVSNAALMSHTIVVWEGKWDMGKHTRTQHTRSSGRISAFPWSLMCNGLVLSGSEGRVCGNVGRVRRYSVRATLWWGHHKSTA